jgi:long-subunit acyl-CoA synthetase (AMP-forming)
VKKESQLASKNIDNMPSRKRKTFAFGGLELNAKSLPALLRYRAKLHPNKSFLQVWSHTNGLRRSISYEELSDAVFEAKFALRKLGVREGAYVAILGHNSVEYITVGLALMSLKAIPVHLNWRQPVNLLEATLKLANCRFLFTSEHFTDVEIEICKSAGIQAPNDLKTFSRNAAADSDAREGVFSDDDDDDDENDTDQYFKQNEVGDTTALVFFTSGSTKTPKAVPHTHYELMWLAHQYQTHLDQGKPDPGGGTLCLFPFFHVMGYVHNFIYNLYTGIRVVIHEETATTSISPELMLKAIKELRPTVVNTVPWIVEGWCQMLDNDTNKDVMCIRDLRYISFGGAALPDYCRTILNFHGVNAIMSYGQTEIGAAVMFTIAGGSLEYMQLLPGVSYELLSDEGSDIAAQNQGKTGELVLIGQFSAAKEYLPGSNARPLAPPGQTTYQYYKTGDVFEEQIMPDGTALLAYRCRHDDLVVHKTGEMSHPIPTEQAILTDTAAFVSKVCYFGQGRTAAILAVQLLPNIDPEEVSDVLWKAISKANSLQPSYSAVTHNAVVIMQPQIHGRLPCTNKGNVQRLKVERHFAQDFTTENSTVHSSRGVALTAVLGEGLLAELDDQEWDSLDFTASSKSRVPPFMVKQFHAYFIAMVAIIIMHMCGARGSDQFALFLEKAGTVPDFLRGLPRGAQLFALPTFIILMGISDYKAFGKAPKGSLLSRTWRDVGRPFLLFFICKFMMPTIAALFLHPYYGRGKGGHVTFNWIFMFMVYARLTSKVLIRGCRLPRWAPAIISLAIHFGCYGGANFCPSPFARSYRLVGYLPSIINCPRFSVYYPFYAVAPVFFSEALFLKKLLLSKIAKVAALLLFVVMVVWAMSGFNLDTSYMALARYSCRDKHGDGCESTWSVPAFAEDLFTFLLCTLSVVCLLIACPTKQSWASAIGQRSLITLIVHLYAIYALTQPLQWLCKWVGKNITPVVLPSLVALIMCVAMQVICCIPITCNRGEDVARKCKVSLIPQTKRAVMISVPLIFILLAICVYQSL